MNKQGTPEWQLERLGMITASRFGDVLVKPKGNTPLSKTAESYMLEKLTEIMTGTPAELSSVAIDWGKEMEAEAREEYQLETLQEIIETGFIKYDDFIGCSPDGLIGDSSGVEFKCPYNSSVHLNYFLGAEIPKQYYAQMQGCMWITGRKTWQFVSYDPRVLNPERRFFVKEIELDRKFIINLQSSLEVFLSIYKQKLALLGYERQA